MSKELIARLRNDSYSLPSDGEWIERNGDTMPNNSCSQAADALEAAEERIAELTDMLGDAFVLRIIRNDVLFLNAGENVIDAVRDMKNKLEIAREAFKKIAEFGDYEMADGDAARDVANEALAQLGDK